VEEHSAEETQKIGVSKGRSKFEFWSIGWTFHPPMNENLFFIHQLGKISILSSQWSEYYFGPPNKCHHCIFVNWWTIFLKMEKILFHNAPWLTIIALEPSPTRSPAVLSEHYWASVRCNLLPANHNWKQVAKNARTYQLAAHAFPHPHSCSISFIGSFNLVQKWVWHTLFSPFGTVGEKGR
jgi:hypothetical protein